MAMTQDEKHTALFSGLAIMIHAAAMQQMGKVKNPATDKVERNLEQAQMSIDMLDMIAAKTKGNLTKDEEQFLQRFTQELKLNYVDEVNKDQPQAKEPS